VTCIVGLEHDGKVLIGGDSAGTNGWHLTVRADEKVFRTGPFVMGFASSFRVSQLLRYKLEPPTPPRASARLQRYMATDFVDACRDVLKQGGVAKVENGVEWADSSFLVGVNGHLFQVMCDFQVRRSRESFDAAGCGDEVALGAMFSTPKLAPRARVLNALRAAAFYSAAVCGPFVVRQS
jgi:ATP-dependent protease HslVU (ClpYQ) peptidase subunit